MIFSVKQLQQKGLAELGVGLIRLYQLTWSKVTSPRCRYNPSCSEYMLQSIEKFGLYDGIQLGWKRIKRCRRPFGGLDPVPLFLSADNFQNGYVKSDNFQTIKERRSGIALEQFEHQFKLILAYPVEREFYSEEELRKKIAEFNDYVLEVKQYAILYKVNKVEVGTINQYYLVRFSGTTSEVYLENKLDEVVTLLISQLEGFFICVQQGEFRPIYFEVDGQVLIEPKPEEPALPKRYSQKENFWQFTDNPNIWDDYWGSYWIADLVDLLSDVALLDEVSGDGCTENIDLNPFDGCDLPEVGSGCDVNPFDGDGCDLSGDGCDTSGCDLGGGCDGCGS